MGNLFYLGRRFDLAAAQPTSEKLYYDPADLTTHAIVTGMTGSGKTGLCIAIMEEAALQGIPAILIDPKGDLTNLLLHFPDLAPQDFAPWLDADALRRQGKTLEQAAQENAERWKAGLHEWGLSPQHIHALKTAVQFGVYTPGSDAGLAISVLSSLQAPGLAWEGNREILREKIASTVTALLGLVGYTDIDPLRSREHILLSNIFEHAWSKNHSLDLTELILQVQNPPFDKLGAFPVENFFPAKERADLALTLNNILASPAFQSWREGQPMHIPDLLYTPEGKPRHSVFYIAHLSEGERMFFVTLLLAAFETWMRTQPGATSLRALLYFDELFGYLPPQHNPPSKTLLLRMLKQARAFGVGLVLATQNPADIDYKGISNAGTWFVGKLQTEWDKQRLLDGLQGASPDLDRATYNKIISALGKRVFLLHNVHQKQPVLFQTRWVMNFLAGPLTRSQIPALNRLAGAGREGVERATGPDFAPVAGQPTSAAPDFSRLQPIPATTVNGTLAPSAAAPLPNTAPTADIPGSLTHPAVPAGVAEYFLPVSLSMNEAMRVAEHPLPADVQPLGLLYRAVLLAEAHARVLDRKLGVDAQLQQIALVDDLSQRSVTIRWENYLRPGLPLERMQNQPEPGARFEMLPAPLGDTKLLNALQKDFVDWVYRSASVVARANEALKVYAGPDVSAAEFRSACADAARLARDKEIARLTASLDRQIAQIQERLTREERELIRDQVEYEQRKREEASSLLEMGASLLGLARKRSITTQVTKNRLTQQAKAEVDESIEAIQQFKTQLLELERQRAEIEQQTNERWAALVNQITEIPVRPRKSDIFLNHFGVAWMPFYILHAAGHMYSVPACQ
ncbi:MAG: hypothetical protein DDG60_04970 [Anaerolineae bacterium]|nr:MAG: hypothetical protein DDG60_04970 [Anaerolineae bacterium]